MSSFYGFLNEKANIFCKLKVSNFEQNEEKTRKSKTAKCKLIFLKKVVDKRLSLVL